MVDDVFGAGAVNVVWLKQRVLWRCGLGMAWLRVAWVREANWVLRLHLRW